MNKKMSKRQKDIKSKLMAAICMLLVSSIMMVSSTYAWFTLSTAPEVTGIQTAVGANGNLEMALQPYSGVLADIKSEEGDSLKLPAQRNITWGNLVDVSDNATYGMNNIKLYPAELNVAEGNIGDNPLKTPVYGADGRVSAVNANTLTGAFDPSKQQFSESMTIGDASYTNAKGVRAIGVSSGLSARELAHRNAMSAAATEKGGANSDAGKTLNRNGADVGKIAVKYATGGGDTYEIGEIAGLQAAVTDLIDITDRIENALKSYLLANSIAPATAENTYAELVTAINNAEDLDAAEDIEGAIVPEDEKYTTAKSQLEAMRTKLETADDILDWTEENKPTVQWSELSGKLSALIDMDKITVNGMTVAEVKAEGGQDLLFEKLAETNYTAQLRMPSGSGIFADIADFTGNYSASFKMTVELAGRNIPVNAEMYATAAETYLDDVRGITAPFSSGDGNTTTANPISNFYGYIIDLAFRTNAANSYLQLQPDAVDRIYSDGTNPDTMGHGATMKFKTDSTSFDQAGVKALMEHVRIVFFNTANNSILAYAKLDAASVTNDGDYVVMPIMLTMDNASTADVDPFEIAKGDDQIMALPQNEAVALSVMVYLDGKTMTNADVAADVAESMYGSMNLQFSSSATLMPMEYADLMAEGSDTNNGPISYAPMNNITKPNGYTVAAYTDNNGNMGFTLNGGKLADGYTVQVKIGDETITPTTEAFAGMEGYKVTHEGLNSATAVEIIVIAPATPEGE